MTTKQQSGTADNETVQNDRGKDCRLIEEYQMCLNGYNYRDQIVPDEFSKLVQNFSIFLTIILAISVFIEVSQILHIILCVLIGMVGFFSIYAILVDMESNLSCKVALRKRCMEIEETTKLTYWKTVEQRPKYREEHMFKGSPGGREQPRRHGNIFITSARLIIVVWILIVFMTTFFGKLIHFSAITQ